MKKLIGGFITLSILMVALLGFMSIVGFVAVNDSAKSYKAVETPVETVTELAETPYTYVITEVNDDEINGKAITNISDSNGGIVLSKSIDNVDLIEGDVIEVVYGEYHDEILDVKLIQ